VQFYPHPIRENAYLHLNHCYADYITDSSVFDATGAITPTALDLLRYQIIHDLTLRHQRCNLKVGFKDQQPVRL
jgi:hypothetical protein